MSQPPEVQKPSPWGPERKRHIIGIPPYEKQSQLTPNIETFKQNVENNILGPTAIEKRFKAAEIVDKIGMLEHVFAENPQSFGYLIVETALHSSDEAGAVAQRIITSNLENYANELRNAYIQADSKDTATKMRAEKLLELDENAYGRSPDQIAKLTALAMEADLKTVQEFLTNITEHKQDLEELYARTKSDQVKAMIVQEYFVLYPKQFETELIRLALSATSEVEQAARLAIKDNARKLEGSLLEMYADTYFGRTGLTNDARNAMLSKIETLVLESIYIPQGKSQADLTAKLDMIKKWAPQSNQE